MVKIGIVYCGLSTETGIMAEAIRDGIMLNQDCFVHLMDVSSQQTDFSLLALCNAIIFGAPTYYGGIPSVMKAFMEKTTKIWQQRDWADKISAAFTDSSQLSGDKLGTLQEFALFAMQHGMIWVGQELITQDIEQNGHLYKANRIGSWLGLMTQPIKITEDNNLKESSKDDILTAKMFGDRIAKITKRFFSK